jgi:hypothetical protein
MKPNLMREWPSGSKTETPLSIPFPLDISSPSRCYVSRLSRESSLVAGRSKTHCAHESQSDKVSIGLEYHLQKLSYDRLG